MFLPRSHMQARLSEAYVRAVAARAGLKIVGFQQEEYGVDTYLQGLTQLPNGRITETGPILQCQLKSTTTSQNKNGTILYDMEPDAYNKLVSSDGRILLLYCMPGDIDFWLESNEENLILRSCCYWEHVAGEWWDKKSKKRVYLPSSHLLTPESLIELMRKLRLGEFTRGSTTE